MLLGNANKAPPAGVATYNPKAGPLLLFAGFKKPLATTVKAAPPKFNVCNGAEYSATTLSENSSRTCIL